MPQPRASHLVCAPRQRPGRPPLFQRSRPRARHAPRRTARPNTARGAAVCRADGARHSPFRCACADTPRTPPPPNVPYAGVKRCARVARGGGGGQDERVLLGCGGIGDPLSERECLRFWLVGPSQPSSTVLNRPQPSSTVLNRPQPLSAVAPVNHRQLLSFRPPIACCRLFSTASRC